ncbi:uncharacterized protein LOC127266426 [Andrographis paniculata]|uniref:uncharacterized protein LOC127266426 n=1 Tax=Andrographis paniculata TaxID=175694 RepID=UPI0021E6FD74|nr:uncharacterized protein LOC127266426 [Andrographis paniculata]
MGQALRRATGRMGGSRVDAAVQSDKLAGRRPPPPQTVVPAEKLPGEGAPSGSESASRVNLDNVLENRDPQFDAMLNQMSGRIQSKPGGPLEMGEGFVVNKYKRPLPKLRNTTVDSVRFEDRPAPPGTLNVAQIRQVILLYQGKSDDHDGPMNVAQIAQLFSVDAAQVEKILQFVSLPPEDDTKRKKAEE